MKFTIGILENLEFIFSFKFLPFLINERSKSPTILFGDQKESSYYSFFFLDKLWSSVLKKRQEATKKYYYISVANISAMRLSLCQLPVVTLPVARRHFRFFIKGLITLPFSMITSWNSAHRLSTLRPTCCITNVNFQLLPCSSY